MKYLCLDSNIYRNLFSPSETFSDEIKDTLLKLVSQGDVKLLLPLQIKQEVERDRVSSWYKSASSQFEEKLNKYDKQVTTLRKGIDEKFGKKDSLLSEIEKEKKRVQKMKDRLKKDYRNKKSKANQTLKKIFENAELIDETQEIISSAELRVKKRNPPRDCDGHFGDAIIWESLLEYFRKRKNKSRVDQLILVSEDKKAWGDEGMDLWLEDEWRKETGTKVLLVHRYSDIPGLSAEDKDKILPEETISEKEQIISDFVSSPNWISAGARAQKILAIKDQLNRDDFERIMIASLQNHEIYGSYFTPIPLEELVSDASGFGLEILDGVDDGLWKSFRDRYRIKVMRRKDIPF